MRGGAMRRLAVLLLVPALAGCPALDVIEGKPSPYKEHIERMALVTVPEAPAEVEVVEPVVPEAPDPMTVEPPPECTSDIYRVSRCVDGKLEEW